MFDSLDKFGAERGLHISEWGLLLFALFVAIGLIGEYKKDSGERWTGLHDTFELLVVIGVVGEVFFDGLIFGFSGRLSVIQDAAVERATISASAATISAGQAIERAGEADERAGKANERAGEANKAAAAANKLAGEAHERAAALEVLAAEKEKQIVELRSLINVREISAVQSASFARGIEGKQRQIVLVLPDEQEPRAYGDVKVRPMLRAAGFTVKLEDLKGTSKHSGLIVCENGAGEINLFKALKSAQIPARLFSQTMKDRPEFCDVPWGGNGGIRVFVGQRIAPYERAPKSR